MKRFIKNIGSLTFIIIFILQVIDWTRPYYYGNSYFISKLNNYEIDRNVVFFGSSRVHNQINPVVFDSVTSSLKFKSYNFGAQACFNPESYYLAERFIRSEKSNNVKYLFIELQKLSDIDPKNSLTTRGYYWNSLHEMLYVYSYLGGDTYLSSSKKIKIGIKYALSFFYKQFDVSRLSLSLKNKKKTNDDLNGFAYLEDKPYLNSNYLESLYDFYEKRDVYSKVNKAHVNKLNKLIEIGNQTNIEVYFILSPKWNDYRFALDIINHLDKDRIIDMTQSSNILKYYSREFSADKAHLNLKGANVYTEDLAKEFLKKL